MSRRVLVVDDEPALRMLVSRGFREQGYEVVEAADGMAALKVAQATPVPFNLVVTNSRMPHIDGPQLVGGLRQLDPKLPIIHLSGSHGSETSKALPPDVPTLFKPFHMEDLLAQAEKLMEERDAR